MRWSVRRHVVDAPRNCRMPPYLPRVLIIDRRTQDLTRLEPILHWLIVCDSQLTSRRTIIYMHGRVVDVCTARPLHVVVVGLGLACFERWWSFFQYPQPTATGWMLILCFPATNLCSVPNADQADVGGQLTTSCQHQAISRLVLDVASRCRYVSASHHVLSADSACNTDYHCRMQPSAAANESRHHDTTTHAFYHRFHCCILFREF